MLWGYPLTRGRTPGCSIVKPTHIIFIDFCRSSSHLGRCQARSHGWFISKLYRQMENILLHVPTWFVPRWRDSAMAVSGIHVSSCQIRYKGILIVSRDGYLPQWTSKILSEFGGKARLTQGTEAGVSVQRHYHHLFIYNSDTNNDC